MPTLVLEILDGIAIDGFLPDAQWNEAYSATLRGYGTTPRWRQAQAANRMRGARYAIRNHTQGEIPCGGMNGGIALLAVLQESAQIRHFPALFNSRHPTNT